MSCFRAVNPAGSGPSREVPSKSLNLNEFRGDGGGGGSEASNRKISPVSLENEAGTVPPTGFR